MKGALVILLAVIGIGIILYIDELRYRRRQQTLLSDNSDSPEGEEDAPKDSERSGEVEISECCGLHLVCEKDSLSPMSAEIVYYDDEELDRFIGRDENSYTAEETEEFRDVLMTLLPEDVAGWARSITQRRLALPPEVRDELLLLVNEQRANG